MIAGGLLATGVPYPTYFAGAQFIHFLLGPGRGGAGLAAVAAPGRAAPALGPAAAGGAGRRRGGQRLGLRAGLAVGLPIDVVLSLAPKSVTAPVAMGIAEKIGGIPALAAVFAVITGHGGRAQRQVPV